MTDRIEKIRTAIHQGLNPHRLEVRDDSAAHAGHAGAIQSGGGHFTVDIVAEAFEGHSAVRRHQLVYSALGDLMKTDIHALIIRAHAPSEVR